MIRCTIEMIPKGMENQARTIGVVEIANTGGDLVLGDYSVVLTKTPPFKGALKACGLERRNSSTRTLPRGGE